MKRLLVLAVAVPSLAFGQGLKWPGSGSPYWGAPFGATGCLADGAYVGFPGKPSTPLTVTRAGSQTVSVPNPNQQIPGLITEDANTVSHVVWNGSALVDTRGNSWTQNGTVPQNAATWNAPPSAGPYSAANNYQASNLALGEWAGDWSVTVVWQQGTVSTQYFLAKGTATSGWLFRQNGGSGDTELVVYDGAAKIANRPGVLNRINVATFGKSGGSCYLRMNAGAAFSVACGAMTAAASEPLRIGRFGSAGGEATLSTVWEILPSTTPYSDALHAARYAEVSGKINQPTLTTCPANSMAVSPSGAEVYQSVTNSALQSSTSCVGNAVQTPWSLAGTPTCVSDAAVAPDGTTTMDEWTNATNTHGVAQTITLPSTTTATFSSWMQKPSAGYASLAINCTAGTPTCSCGTSDGSACGTRVSVTTCIGDFSAISTTPVRGWLAATCTGAQTSFPVNFTPGQNSLSTGTTRFWGAQVHPGLYPLPYTPTTTVAATTNSTVASIPLPSLTGNNWCVGVTATAPRAWNTTGTPRILAAGTSGAANTFYLSGQYFGVYDNAASQKYISMGAQTANVPHRIVACNAAGSISLLVDGTNMGAATGSTGIWSASPASLTIGGDPAGASQWDGSISNVKIYPNQTFRAGM